MNDYYILWQQQLSVQSRIGLILAAAAANAVLVVRFSLPARRALLLRLAAWGYGALAAVIIVAGLLSGDVTMPTGGLVLHKPLWYDETFTALVSSLPFDRMMTAIAGDVHPPLWYIIEWATVRLLGRSEIALRLPAVACAAVAVYLTWRVALALGLRRETAALAAVLLALLPGQIYYAQEARMYMLLQVAVLLAALGIFTRRPRLMAAGMVAALYTHNIGAVYVALLAELYIWVEGVLSIWRLMVGDIKFPKMALIMLRDWLLPLAAVVVAYLPWLAVTLRQARAVNGGFWLPRYDVGGYITETIRAVMMGTPAFLSVNLALLIVGLAALLFRRDAPAVTVPTRVLAFGPPLILALVSAVWRPVFLHRAIVPALPWLAIGAAAAIDRMSAVHRRVILAVTALSLVVGVGFVRKPEGEMGRWLADQVRDRCESGATLWHANLASYISLAYYLPGCKQAVWPDAGNLSQALTIPTQQAMGIERKDAADITGTLVVVWIENPMTAPGEVAAMEAALALGRADLIVEADHPLMKCHMYDVHRKITTTEVLRK